MNRLLIIVLAMAMSLATDAQDYTQKYNRLMEPALPAQGYKGQLR